MNEMVRSYEIIQLVQIGTMEFAIGGKPEGKKPYVLWWCRKQENGKQSIRGKYFSDRFSVLEAWCQRILGQIHLEKQRKGDK